MMPLPLNEKQNKTENKHKTNPNTYIWWWSQNANFHGCQSSLFYLRLCPCFLTIWEMHTVLHGPYICKSGPDSERKNNKFLQLWRISHPACFCCCFVVFFSFCFVLFSWGIASLTSIGITARTLHIEWRENLLVWTLYFFSLYLTPLQLEHC